MISIVCVYNKQSVLRKVLLKSLEKQTAEFELITLDNSGNRFKSASEALNHGGRMAKGKYIMFIHQDVWLEDPRSIEKAERILDSLPDLGVAGVVGVSDDGDWRTRGKHSIIFHDKGFNKLEPVKKPEEVQTLDECVLIAPRTVFVDHIFDEDVFDGWDSYGPDYCLSVKQSGLKAYVIPLTCRHCCTRAKTRLWGFKNLLKYQKRLYRKHKHNHKTIYTWMGVVSRSKLLIYSMLEYIGPLYDHLFPDLSRLLSGELSGCDTVLDLGCGYRSILYTCKVPFCVGVDWSEYCLQESSRYFIHNHYVRGDIRSIAFKPKTFDAVIAVGTFDHFSHPETADLLSKTENWATKKIVFTASNRTGYSDLATERKDHWSQKTEWERQGFKIRGLGGWKILKEKNTYNFWWSLLVNVTQRIVYYFPNQASEILAVKQIEPKKTIGIKR